MANQTMDQITFFPANNWDKSFMGNTEARPKKPESRLYVKTLKFF